MFTPIMIVFLTINHVRSVGTGSGIFCLTTKRVGLADFEVKPERCAPGVEHCLITLSLTNDSTGYERQNFHCWPWPELQSSCPSEPGICQLLHRSDDQLHSTCCCLGSMCNNATLTYASLRNESGLSIELRSRLETFGLRDVDGQPMPRYSSHFDSFKKTTFRTWFESQSTRLVLICLVVLVIGLSVGLIALVHHCPAFYSHAWSTGSPVCTPATETNNRASFWNVHKRFHFLRARRKLRSDRSARRRSLNLAKCYCTKCIWPFGSGSRVQNAQQVIRKVTDNLSDQSVEPNWSSQHRDTNRWSDLSPTDKSSIQWPHEYEAVSDLLLISPTQSGASGRKADGYPGSKLPRGGPFSPSPTKLELDQMQRVSEACQLLRLLDQGRFAQVWLAKLDAGTTPFPLDSGEGNRYRCTDPLGGCPSPEDQIPNNTSLDEHHHSNRRFALPEEVAVKVFSAAEQRAWANEFAVLRAIFCHETHLFGMVHHTGHNLVHMFGAGKVHEQYRLVLEFATQGSLRDWLDRGKWLTFSYVLQLTRDVVRGLSYLHADYPTSGKPSIAHRDVKPENILVRADGSACLSDFGQAVILSSGPADEANRSDPTNSTTVTTTLSTNLTSHGTNLDAVPKAGTLRYMAPEILDGAIQFNGRSVLCTDIYSLALCMWELLSAALPPPTNSGLTADSDRILSTPDSRRVWLPYELELGRNCLSPEVMHHFVSVLKHRPQADPAWFELPVYTQFYRTITESWDSEPEARLSATCVLARLNAIQAQLDKSTNRTTSLNSTNN